MTSVFLLTTVRNSDTLKFFGSGQIIDAVQYPNLSLLPNGIFLYNGWDEKAYSGDMLPPFKGAWGIWIRKTQYGLTTDDDGVDVVISENGDIFTKPRKNSDWIRLNDEVVKYVTAASDFPDLTSLIEFYSTWNKPYMFGLDWTSNLAPDGRTTVGIGVRGVIWAFTLHGGIYVANEDNPQWTEVVKPQQST